MHNLYKRRFLKKLKVNKDCKKLFTKVFRHRKTGNILFIEIIYWHYTDSWTKTNYRTKNEIMFLQILRKSGKLKFKPAKKFIKEKEW